MEKQVLNEVIEETKKSRQLEQNIVIVLHVQHVKLFYLN